MRDPSRELTKKVLQKYSDTHYITHDRRMSVWIWRQIVLIEVSGAWDPTVAKGHLDRLFGDFQRIRQHWPRVFSIIDLQQFDIQTVDFRAIVKNYWSKFFNRSDLMICFIENHALRRAIRAAILALIPKSHNIYLRKNFKEISDLILPLIRAEKLEEGSGDKGELGSDRGSDNPLYDIKQPLNVPERLTYSWFRDHAQLHFIGANGKWAVTAWNNVVFLKISRDWTPEEGDEYIDHLSGIPGVLSEKWAKVFFIFDISEMVFKPEDLHLYMRSKWLRTLDHEDLSVCLVETKKMRRMLLSSMYKLLGKRNRIQIFASPDRALEWVRVDITSKQPLRNGK